MIKLWTFVLFVFGLAPMIGLGTVPITAELMLRTGQLISPPLLERGAFDGFLSATCVLVVLAALTGFLLIAHRAIPRPLVYSLVMATVAVVATLSLQVAIYPTLNLLYDHYQSNIANATTWAPGYSDDRFSRVATGMTETQVLETAGKPLWRQDQKWGYSQLGHYQTLAAKGFHERTVVFRDGVVVNVTRRYRPGDASESF